MMMRFWGVFDPMLLAAIAIGFLLVAIDALALIR
jgi:hypothetical protein